MANLKDGLDDITQDLGQSFEEAQNTLQLKAQIQMMRYIKDKNWMQKQIAASNNFKLDLFRVVKRELNIINQKYDKAFSNSFKNANQDMTQEAKARLLLIKKQNATMMSALANQIINARQRWVTEIGLKMGQSIEIAPLERTNELYNQITKVLSSNEAQDVVKVAYRNGNRNARQMPFKSYMEMNARTTLNQEIAKQQMEAAPSIGVDFWLCNSFENCRTTHIAFQGRVYFDERYTSYGYDEETIKKIESAIDSRKMMSRQQVENNDPFLGNCPNCRHEFIAVPIEDVISMSDKELLKDNNMNVNKATQNKYEITQEQRMYERKIRKYKFEIEKNKIQLDSAPKGVDTSNTIAQKQLTHNRMMLNNYREKITTLVNKHDYLERDYARESVKILREDLGFRQSKTKK